MLQVHPDSTCDVCLDPYFFSNPAKTPHAIACGHVFCLECLSHLNHPPSCPLCRKTFGMDRVKKLHVDPHVPGEREAALPEAWSLVQRLSRCARSEVSIQATDELIGEAQRWLETGNRKELFPEVDAVFSALVKYKSLQERFHDQQNMIASLTTRLHREETRRDEVTRDALVEHGLTRKIKDLETELDYYKKHFPGFRDIARENPRANSPTSEDRANGSRNTSHQGNPLPSPPKPKWHSFTARNPNFVPPSQEPYLRTSIPPVPSQPYVHQTGAGAVFYEGASYDERVVPPPIRDMASRDAAPERERARSVSGHRDHSAERRNRRRDEESDRARRRRDRHRRGTLEGAVEPTGFPGDPALVGNALGIHPSSLRPGQEQYTSMPPPVTPDPTTSRAGGAPSSRPPTSHGIPPPPFAGNSTVPGFAYRDPPYDNGASSFYSQPGDNNSISRPSSTPIGPVHLSWTAPGLANPSLNSLGLSEPVRDGGSNNNSQRARPMSASARDNSSVSSWGTADSTPAQGDLFASLRPLSNSPADSGFPTSDLFTRPDGQLLGVGRPAPIVTPQPQLPPPYMPPIGRGLSERDVDNRSYSRQAQNPRSQSQASLFSPNDRGFPYASVPPQPAFPMPSSYASPRSATPGTGPSSHSNPMPLTLMTSFPQSSVPPPPINSASRPPNNTSQPYFPGSSTPQSQNSNYR